MYSVQYFSYASVLPMSVKLNGQSTCLCNVMHVLTCICIHMYSVCVKTQVKNPLLLYLMWVHSLSGDVGWTNCTSHLINDWPNRYRGSSTGERS